MKFDIKKFDFKKLNFKKIVKDYGSRIALIAAAVALLLFIPAGLTKSTGWFVFLTILIVLLLGGGGLLLFFSTKQEKVHFFLYDPKTGKSVKREALTAAIVQNRICAYLHTFKKSPLSLWEDLPRELREQFEKESVYRPLVMYAMLVALAGCPERHIPTLFKNADIRVVSYLCRSINETGDKELADYIYNMKKNDAPETTVAPFFLKNADRFGARALHYVQKNFDQFFVAKESITK